MLVPSIYNYVGIETSYLNYEEKNSFKVIRHVFSFKN